MQVFNYFGEGTSPVIHGDALVVNWDHQDGSFITVLDAQTGEPRWKAKREENSSWATPLIVDHNGQTQVIVSGTNRVRSYDIKTGDVIWECGGQVLACIPCPVTDGRLVFVMTGYTGSALFAIPLDSKGDITDTDKVAWKRKEPGTPYVPSPLLYGEQLCFTSVNKGLYSCLDATNGTPLIDRKRVEGISNIYASPVGGSRPDLFDRTRRHHSRPQARRRVRDSRHQQARRPLRRFGSTRGQTDVPPWAREPVLHRSAVSTAATLSPYSD